MSESDDRFLSRWSRRKHRSRQASIAESASVADSAAGPQARPEEPPRKESEPVNVVAPDVPGNVAPERSVAPEPATQPSAAERLPLPAVETLTPASDFRPFMQAGVDALTRNSALKRLFSDPHFNVMDGLDTYIDDYNKTEPIPAALLAGLKQLHSIGVTDEAGDVPAIGAQASAAYAPHVEAGAQASPAHAPDAEADVVRVAHGEVAHGAERREAPSGTGDEDEPEPPTDKTTPEEPSE